MDTQQIGIDISADVSFNVSLGAIVLVPPPYQFKGRVAYVSVGVYDVTINDGEGIDLAHAEINVSYTPAITVPDSSCLSWNVERRPNTALGEIVYRVAFTQPTAFAGPSIVFTPIDVAHASITIRRKIPAVN